MNRTPLLGLALLLTFLFAAGTTAQAQMRGGNNFWKCTLTGGTYEVALHAITSISIHDYTVEGGIQISEMVIDTLGNTEARFYFMQTSMQANAAGMGGPASTVVDAATSRGQDAVTRAGTVAGGSVVDNAVNTSVIKNYPTTTHAHTVEYRVGSAAELTALFNSVETSWKTNVNSSYPPPAATSS